MVNWENEGQPHYATTMDGEVIFDESEDVPAPDGTICGFCQLPDCGGSRRCISISIEQDAWLKAIAKKPDNDEWVDGCTESYFSLGKFLSLRIVTGIVRLKGNV